MKIRFLGLVLLLAAAGSTEAQTKVEFTGNLLASTCTIEVEGGGSDGNVTLPRVQASLLAKQGDRAGRTRIRIRLGSATSPCPQVGIQLAFKGGDINAEGRLKNTSNARNVDLVLMNAQDPTMPRDINLSDNTNSQRIVIGDTGFQIYNFAVEYYATGKASGGLVASTVQFDLVYD